MINQIQKKILILALYAGEIMLRSGAEIYRVEDTVTRICKACNIPYAEVFATTTGIFVSVDDGSEHSDMHTFLKRIHSSSIDLEKISKINQFSRNFATNEFSVEEGMQMLKDINRSFQFSFLWRVLGAGMIASFFTLMLGGLFSDFLASFAIGILTYFVTIFLERLQLNLFIKDFCSCAVVALLALLFSKIGLGHNPHLIIIGSIMIFLPGVSITNAVRDSLTGDLVSGLSRAMEAILVAIAIAAGVGLVLKIFGAIGGVY
ncbi:threonine/serine exporter family protein [Sinanaerobacter sp. ZZT-01]|uniref:threonine/serine ThrE exporter family protein n=1 Tax=Sinanaerobacter sp. ZZT-01 TaxID=3111540 RepID=UPI002D799FFE|nr:threonine/serine exporter family protein [Sinanaerobacter sp. ZZT-01]WRR94578.1 threonine/serine exporter family protein [Sinanaerobacter sp. ZZT-01]